MNEERDEFAKKAALLRRFKELLVQQRGKFERYLKVLDSQRGDIETGDVDKLVVHVELEQQIVSEIYTFQKVIDPLDELYRSEWKAGAPPAAAGPGRRAANREGDAELSGLKDALKELQSEVLRRNEANRALLKSRLELMRSEIAGLRNPLRARKSVYSDSEGGSLVDIKG